VGQATAKARTGARYASEKQVLRCAQNDNQISKGKSNGNSKRRSRSLRDDSQKGKGKGKSKGNYRGPSLRSG
jgi:ribosomal protein L19E